MNILIIGEEQLRAELKLTLPDSVNITEVEDQFELEELDELFQIIFDLDGNNFANDLEIYLDSSCKSTALILNSVNEQLASRDIYDGVIDTLVIGMNTLPTFINRPIKEISLLQKEDSESVNIILKSLGWDYRVVEDRVGMVTPRIICMIINEACFTLQEGTATVADIDKSMKLGTAYPYGPFEWADKIGIDNVYTLLNAIYEDTQDGRYKVCPLIKTKFLKEETFY